MARYCFRRAAQLAPHDPQIRLRAANFYFRNHEIEPALRLDSTILQQLPDYDQTIFSSYVRMGEGSVRIASRTGDVRRIAWTSSPLPPETGIARITWTVDFQTVEIAGRLCTMPLTGVYRIARSGSGNRADWNVTEFSAYGRYGSAATVRFEP
jgi:hypothetical protein